MKKVWHSEVKEHLNQSLGFCTELNYKGLVDLVLSDKVHSVGDWRLQLSFPKVDESFCSSQLGHFICLMQEVNWQSLIEGLYWMKCTCYNIVPHITEKTGSGSKTSRTWNARTVSCFSRWFAEQCRSLCTLWVEPFLYQGLPVHICIKQIKISNYQRRQLTSTWGNGDW